MHFEAMTFLWCATMGRKRPSLIYEAGSRDVNGSPRCLFPGVSYFGIDYRPGVGVDVLADCAMWTPREPADLVICTEVLEHARSASKIVLNLATWLTARGLLLLTAAGPGRKRHSAIDGFKIRRGEFYRNVRPEHLHAWLDAAGLKHRIWREGMNCDVYAAASPDGGIPSFDHPWIIPWEAAT